MKNDVSMVRKRRSSSTVLRRRQESWSDGRVDPDCLDVRVRPIAPGDERALQDLLESNEDYTERITGYPPGPADALSTVTMRPEDLPAESKHDLALWRGSSMDAFADVLRGWPEPVDAHIGLLMVRGGSHGSGLGRRMHEAVLDLVRSWPKINRVRLGIVAANAGVAEPFWRGLGYEPTGETKPYEYGPVRSTTAIWMREV